MLTLNMSAFWIVFNIIILFILLRIFLFKPVMGIIEKRQKLIQGQLDDAGEQK